MGAESRRVGKTVQTGQLHRMIIVLYMVSVYWVALGRFQFYEFIWCPLNKPELLAFVVSHNQKFLQLNHVCEDPTLSLGFEPDSLLASFGAFWLLFFWETWKTHPLHCHQRIYGPLPCLVLNISVSRLKSSSLLSYFLYGRWCLDSPCCPVWNIFSSPVYSLRWREQTAPSI